MSLNMIDHTLRRRLDVAVALAAFLALIGRAFGQDDQINLKEKYHESFTGSAEKHPAWGLYGQNAATFVKFEPQGLRFNLPAGFEGARPSIGVTTRVSVKGDFRITASFEILQEPEAAAIGKGQTR